MIKRTLALFSALLALASPAWCEPTVTVKTETYDIYGTTAKELRNQMVLFGVTWRDGKKYDALTTWFTRWNYTWESGVHSCKITGVRTSVEVIHRIPRWVNPDQAPPALWSQWERYMENLLLHERGHRDIGIAAASEIEAAIGRMPPERSCKALETTANALGERTLERYRELEADYDKNTGHGRTQGAVFP